MRPREARKWLSAWCRDNLDKDLWDGLAALVRKMNSKILEREIERVLERNRNR